MRIRSIDNDSNSEWKQVALNFAFVLVILSIIMIDFVILFFNVGFLCGLLLLFSDFLIVLSPTKRLLEHFHFHLIYYTLKIVEIKDSKKRVTNSDI